MSENTNQNYLNRLDELEEKIISEKTQLTLCNLRKSGIENRLSDYKKQLQAVCQHEHLEEKTSYFGGSFSDHAYTNYWNECTRCGVKSAVTTKTHSYYG